MDLLQYQHQDCELTLAEGLAEYFAQIDQAALLTGDDDDNGDDAKDGDSLRSYLLGHDCQHVVFGLGVTLEEESILDTWAFNAVDHIPWKLTFKYTFSGGELTKLFKKLFKEVGFFKTMSIPYAVRKQKRIAYKNIKLMEKKWPWYVPDEFMSRSLRELREEFGINVLDKDELGIQHPIPY
jgi:hypothetical protein